MSLNLKKFFTDVAVVVHSQDVGDLCFVLNRGHSFISMVLLINLFRSYHEIFNTEISEGIKSILYSEILE